MELKELLERFDSGETIGTDPEVIIAMREQIKSNRRYLFEIKKWLTRCQLTFGFVREVHSLRNCV